ncbi:AEC family transporter [Candidatus Magnetomoraceae bacterium gMMP-15]
MIFNSLFSIFVLILIGYIFNRNNFPDNNFWPFAARFTYFALFPALIVNKFATASFEGYEIISMSAGLIIAVLLLSLVLIVLRAKLKFNHAAFTSMFQGSMRPNIYIGLAAAAALYGDAGIILGIIALAILIPLVNLVSVSILGRYAESNSSGWKNAFLSILRNPLIIACALGLLLNIFHVGLPFGSKQVLEILSQAAIPFGLLTIGADLDFSAIKTRWSPLILTSFLKLLLLPLLTIIISIAINLNGIAVAIAVIFTSVPCSATSYVLSGQSGGDFKLMAGILTVETVMAAITMPIILNIIKYMI